MYIFWPKISFDELITNYKESKGGHWHEIIVFTIEIDVTSNAENGKFHHMLIAQHFRRSNPE